MYTYLLQTVQAREAARSYKYCPCVGENLSTLRRDYFTVKKTRINTHSARLSNRCTKLPRDANGCDPTRSVSFACLCSYNHCEDINSSEFHYCWLTYKLREGWLSTSAYGQRRFTGRSDFTRYFITSRRKRIVLRSRPEHKACSLRDEVLQREYYGYPPRWGHGATPTLSNTFPNGRRRRSAHEERRRTDAPEPPSRRLQNGFSESNYQTYTVDSGATNTMILSVRDCLADTRLLPISYYRDTTHSRTQVSENHEIDYESCQYRGNRIYGGPARGATSHSLVATSWVYVDRVGPTHVLSVGYSVDQQYHRR